MYKYTHFIPQNIAPKGAKAIGVYRNGVKIKDIPLGRMTPLKDEPRYRFGLISDTHISHSATAAYQPNQKLDIVLSTLDNTMNCDFVVICGDLTNGGFYRGNTATDAYFDETQMTNYAAACKKINIPVYAIFGNHENYLGKSIADVITGLKSGTLKIDSTTGEGVILSEDDIKEMYGINTNFFEIIEYKGDLFILVDEVHSVLPMSDDGYTKLCQTLIENTDKRCFIFIHSFLDNDSGNANGVQENSLFNYWELNKKGIIDEFKTMLSNHKNAILFHGHSHLKFEWQKFDKNANFTEINGFKSIHIPSSATPRYNVDEEGTTAAEDNNGSEGYIVDVYDDCIVLNGYDFINKNSIPIGTYKINITN